MSLEVFLKTQALVKCIVRPAALRHFAMFALSITGKKHANKNRKPLLSNNLKT
jgi:hypothetical protein